MAGLVSDAESGCAQLHPGVEDRPQRRKLCGGILDPMCRTLDGQDYSELLILAW